MVCWVGARLEAFAGLSVLLRSAILVAFFSGMLPPGGKPRRKQFPAFASICQQGWIGSIRSACVLLTNGMSLLIKRVVFIILLFPKTTEL